MARIDRAVTHIPEILGKTTAIPSPTSSKWSCGHAKPTRSTGKSTRNATANRPDDSQACRARRPTNSAMAASRRDDATASSCAQSVIAATTAASSAHRSASTVGSTLSHILSILGGDARQPRSRKLNCGQNPNCGQPQSAGTARPAIVNGPCNRGASVSHVGGRRGGCWNAGKDPVVRATALQPVARARRDIDLPKTDVSRSKSHRAKYCQRKRAVGARLTHN